VWGTGGSAGSNHGHRTDIEPQLLEALPIKTNIIDISCGLGHTLFLTDSGLVYSWGNGGSGRLGVGDNADRAEATLLTQFCTAAPGNSQESQIPRISAVQCGACHSLALSASGSVYVWGKNSQGQCGLGHTDDVLRPTLVPSLGLIDAVCQISAGWEHSVARTETGALFAWGSGYKDSRRGVVPPVLGLGSNEGRQTPQQIVAVSGVFITSIACGWDHCLALDDKGFCYSWGSGQNGKLGHGNDENVAIPMHITSLERETPVRSISAGCEHSAAIGVDGRVYTWGQGDGGRLGRGGKLITFWTIYSVKY
jgi:alpha-tubulin suppressor-like RCC1 family protein